MTTSEFGTTRRLFYAGGGGGAGLLASDEFELGTLLALSLMNAASGARFLPLLTVSRSRAALAAATRAAVTAQPSGRDAEALAAFVFAWHQHWPGAFDTAFGEHGASLVGWAGQQFTDDNRYLKLRRIAISNLAHVL
jgi:hypothetical protein